MTTRVPIRYGGTGANTAADARTALGVAPAEAFDVANTASSTANAAYSQANSAYAQANAAYDAANNAQVTVYSNNASNVTTQNVNFVNTATVTVTVTADGANANIEFTAAPQTVVNDTYTAAGNTAAAATANIANGLYAISTSAYDQANAAYGQANDAYAAANTANTNALAAYGQANLAYAQANAAYGQANLAYNEANLKLNLSGGSIVGDLNITGNLFVNGTETIVNTESLTINDPIFLLANNNTTNAVGLGFTAHYGPTQQHTGLIRAHQDNIWYLFEDYDEHILYANNVLDTGNIKLATLKANINANSLLLVGNTVATQANLTIAYDTANSAYSQANLAYAQANAGYDQANAAYGQANLAYTQANTARTTANDAYGQANSAYTAANNAANTVRVSQNGSSTLSAKQLNFVNTANVTIAVTDSGDGNANIEFEVAAGGGGTLSNIAVSSNGTFTTNANGFNFVNTATVQITVEPGVDGNANISFESSGSGGTVVVRDNFTGDGNTVNFTLTTEPEDQSHTLVFVDLVFQSETAYSVSGSTLTFGTAPDNGANIDVYIYGGGVGSTVVTSDVFTGTGACTSYQLTQTATTSRTFIYLDGVAQRPEYDYQVSGTTLSFNVAPANATVIEARTLSAFNTVDLNINVAPVSLYSDKFTGTGSCTVFTLSQTGTTDSTFVFLNGVSQKPGTDFSVGGVGNTTLTMTSPPANGSVLEVRTVGAFKLAETQSRIESDIFTGDGNTASFTMSSLSTTKKAFAFIDGVSQKPFTDYTVGGNIITFTEAPPDGTFIEVRSVAPFIFATSTGDLAYDLANLAFTQANSAYTQANNAFAAANNRVLKTGDTMTGNLTFSGTGLRILGDFSNGNANSRVSFQSTTANDVTYVNAIPSGNSKWAGFFAYNDSEAANGIWGGVYVNNGSCTVGTSTVGGAAQLPLVFLVGSERMRISDTGNVGIGTTAPNTRLHIAGTTTLQEVLEKVNVSATAMGANTFVNVLDGAITLLTSNSTANSTLNIRGNSSVALNSIISTNQSLTAVVMITNGATAYRIANLQIDGTAVTPKWSGGSAPTASANSIDAYSYTIVKTAANTYTVLGSKTQFA